MIRIRVEATFEGSLADENVIIKQFNDSLAKKGFITDVCYEITCWIETQLDVDSIDRPEVIARCEEW